MGITVYTPAAMPANEAARQQAVNVSGLLPIRVWPELDLLAAAARKETGMHTGLVTVVSDYNVYVIGRNRVPYGAFRRSSSFVGHMIADDADELVVPDTLADDRFAGNPNVLDGDLRFIASAAYRDSERFMLGSISVTRGTPDPLWSSQHQLYLQTLASQIMKIVGRNRSTSLRTQSD